MHKAIIWDMDGVILDSELFYDEVRRDLAAQFGLTLNIEHLKQFRGRNEPFYEVISKHHGNTLDFEDFFIKYHEILEEFYSHRIPLAEHVHETLRALGAKFPMALATNTNRSCVNRVFERYKLSPYFQSIFTGDDVVRRKPDPEIFLKAAAALGVEPEACIVIEDSEAGFRAATGAGMRLIARKTPDNLHQDFSPAEYTIEQLSEIPELLNSLA
ncbi:hypothetical protein COV82_05780 [Candidatus Peregrinibacteria bacterium CG11_big_fil_rev_8_21_14_0_20_46_8]|nr:MAG: hypothetical protein COV82_05780 [Candidatus Peregrinibacteria bacterium CG11_big_fil_rev_8_21_14_0_20_46_8]